MSTSNTIQSAAHVTVALPSPAVPSLSAQTGVDSGSASTHRPRGLRRSVDFYDTPTTPQQAVHPLASSSDTGFLVVIVLRPNADLQIQVSSLPVSDTDPSPSGLHPPYSVNSIPSPSSGSTPSPGPLAQPITTLVPVPAPTPFVPPPPPLAPPQPPAATHTNVGTLHVPQLALSLTSTRTARATLRPPRTEYLRPYQGYLQCLPLFGGLFALRNGKGLSCYRSGVNARKRQKREDEESEGEYVNLVLDEGGRKRKRC